MVAGAMLGMLMAAQAAVYDPADPARFEPLFRARWEATGDARSARDYGLFLLKHGDRARAVPVLRKALALDESAEALDALAAVVPAAEARKLLARAAELRPSGDALRKLASAYEAGGDLDAAAKHYRAALALYQKEGSNAKVAVVLNDLGLLLENRREYARAEPLYRRALAIQETALGAAHPEVGTTLNNLGSAVGGAGRLKEAEPLLRRALGVLEEALGERHSRVAACAANLAGLLAALDRPADSRALYARAAAIYDALGDAASASEARTAAAEVR